MNILSLYDGMSCGMLALRDAGIPVDRYVAYEIDKYAVQVSEHNFPEIEHKGDVFKGDFTECEGFDAVIGGSPCFCAGTMIFTSDGMKPIEDVKIGDMVYTHKHRFRKVTAVGNKVADVYRVSSQGVPDFYVTENHPFYVRSMTRRWNKGTRSAERYFTEPEWKEVCDLCNSDNARDFFASPILTECNDMHNLTEEQCWILGRYVADGHWRCDKRKNRKNSYQYQFILSIGNKKVEDVKEKIKSYHYSCYPHTKSTFRIVISDMNLVNFVKDNDFGKGAYNKNIPNFILDLPIELAKSFLEGYISGDGAYCKQWDSWSCTTISRRLAYSLALLIQKVYGVNASISYKIPKSTTIIGGRTVCQHPQWIITFRKELRKQAVAKRIKNELYTPYKSTEYVGIDIVYNISVDEDESYLANNRIVHNCTYWSIAQSPDRRETEAHGIGWELFQQYVRAIREAKPRWFLYENNKSMAPAIKKEISETFGFEPILVNSALVSAQKRERYYWVGVRKADGTYKRANVTLPEDRGIFLKDILDSNWQAMREKGHAVIASAGRTTTREFFIKNQGNMVAGRIVGRRINESGHRDDYNTSIECVQRFEANDNPQKTNCLTTVQKDNMIAELVCHKIPQEVTVRKYTCDIDALKQLLRKNKTKTNREIAETLGKPVTLVEHWFRTDDCFSVPDADVWFSLKELLNIESTEFDDFVTVFETREGIFEKSQRCYDVNGKMSTIMAGLNDSIIQPTSFEPISIAKRTRDNADGSKTKRFEANCNKGNCITTVQTDSMVAEPIRIGELPSEDGSVSTAQAKRIYSEDGKSVTLKANGGGQGAKTGLYAESAEEGANKNVYEVKNGMISVKGREYPIKLKDGKYIIRKLTVSECKRLQTVPEEYDMSVISDTQAYKCLGNGWTVKVISHLMNCAVNSLDAPISEAVKSVKFCTLDDF